MAATLGNSSKCYIGTSISGTWNLLAGESSNSVNLSSNPVEVSDKSSAWQKFISGMRGGTADVTVWADNSDSQQKSLLTSFKAGTSVFVFIGEMSSGAQPSPSKGIACEAVISSISDTNDNGSASSRSISLQLTGEPTIYPTA